MNPAGHQHSDSKTGGSESFPDSAVSLNGPKRSLHILSGAVLTALLFAACGPQITNANIEVVNKQFEQAQKQSKGSVSPKEVESVLGLPQRTETKTVTLETQKKEVESVRYFYKQDGQTIEMLFLDNKLTARIPHLEDPTKATPQPTTSQP